MSVISMVFIKLIITSTSNHYSDNKVHASGLVSKIISCLICSHKQPLEEGTAVSSMWLLNQNICFSVLLMELKLTLSRPWHENDSHTTKTQLDKIITQCNCTSNNIIHLPESLSVHHTSSCTVHTLVISFESWMQTLISPGCVDTAVWLYFW